MQFNSVIFSELELRNLTELLQFRVQELELTTNFYQLSSEINFLVSSTGTVLKKNFFG